MLMGAVGAPCDSASVPCDSALVPCDSAPVPSDSPPAPGTYDMYILRPQSARDFAVRTICTYCGYM